MRKWNSSVIANEVAAHKSNPMVVYTKAGLPECVKYYGCPVEPIVDRVLCPLGWPQSSSAVFPFPDEANMKHVLQLYHLLKFPFKSN